CRYSDPLTLPGERGSLATPRRVQPPCHNCRFLRLVSPTHIARVSVVPPPVLYEHTMSFSSYHLYFDDLEVGQEWTSGGRTITEADIVNLAGLSGDFNPTHIDHEL